MAYKVSYDALTLPLCSYANFSRIASDLREISIQNWSIFRLGVQQVNLLTLPFYRPSEKIQGNRVNKMVTLDPLFCL